MDELKKKINKLRKKIQNDELMAEDVVDNYQLVRDIPDEIMEKASRHGVGATDATLDGAWTRRVTRTKIRSDEDVKKGILGCISQEVQNIRFCFICTQRICKKEVKE